MGRPTPKPKIIRESMGFLPDAPTPTAVASKVADPAVPVPVTVPVTVPPDCWACIVCAACCLRAKRRVALSEGVTVLRGGTVAFVDVDDVESCCLVFVCWREEILIRERRPAAAAAAAEDIILDNNN